MTNSLSKYFEENQAILQKNYPGLKLQRLEEELQYFKSHKRGDEAKFKSLLEEGTPLEYINQRSHFYGYDFEVTPDVLIPRFETEILVEVAVKLINGFKKEKLSILDMGCGSGCIGLTILKESKSHLLLSLSDISPNALKIAKNNAKLLGINPQAYICTDRLEGLDKFDFIITNPPYIKLNSDRDQVHEKVLEFEPELALFLEDDEYQNWFEKLFKDAHKHLNPKGWFLMEGHEKHLLTQENLLKDAGFYYTEIKNDYTGRPRFLFGQKHG